MKNPVITIPDTTKGNFLTNVRSIWYACYELNGKPKRKSMQTPHFDIALSRRDAFFESLKAPVRVAKTPAEKIALDPNKYIYVRPKFSVVVGKKHLGFFKTKKLAIEARDNYINNQQHE